MNNTGTRTLLVILLSLAASTALGSQAQTNSIHLQPDLRHRVSAPEIDPAQALGALILLSGTVAIVRGYRRKQK